MTEVLVYKTIYFTNHLFQKNQSYNNSNAVKNYIKKESKVKLGYIMVRIKA